MNRTIFHIIPSAFRRRSYGVVLTIFVRALLNYVGLAVLLPVLALILDPEVIRTNTAVAALYEWGGFSSPRAFVLAICAAVVVVTLLKCLLNLVLYRSERNYIYDLYTYMSRRLYVEYHDRGLSFVKKSNSAVLARNVNVVCLTFVTGILMPIATIAGETMLFALLFGSLALYNPLAALLLMLLFAGVVGLYYGLVRRRLLRYGEAENRAHREKARIVTETFRGYPDIEISNAFPMTLRAFDRTTAEIVRTRSKEAVINLLPQTFTEIGLSAGMALLVVASLWYGGENMQLFFGFFAVAAVRLVPSIRNVMAGWASIKYNRYTIDILRDAPIHADQTAPHEEQARLLLSREIDIRNLSFRFPDAEIDTIHNLSCSIHKGERIGIRGASGAGKTTLFNLLLGFYTPTAGEITIDGTPLTSKNRRAWQNAIGYVPQHVFLTDDTFLANIALGIPSEQIDRTRAAEAVKAARLDEFIAALPAGMDTPIGECGCRISGGQQQRIGIARALYKQADVLFFDEATSSLDSLTEQNVNRSIEELSASNKELTIIVIAHRDSSLAYCDRIITIGE